MQYQESLYRLSDSLQVVEYMSPSLFQTVSGRREGKEAMREE
jgi:hypothetical protein